MDAIIKAITIMVAHITVFYLAAWLIFTRKDIQS
jgi:ABC-type transport system involved in multi-copper enzyme maturation permease subunit